ncbi:MAG TPA: hypothetical protein VGO50_03465 [Pyrinomonadaceae bacterium]|jgi:hypothetical protein|nr:hypothetical protein [Pyrinomonadaceae bacterium]
MKRSLLIVPVVLLINLLCGAAWSQEKCFRSEWLQQSHHIVFKINGTNATGRFIVSRDGEDTAYDLTGTVKANILTVKFAGGKMPDISPSEMRGTAWTILSKGTEEILRIKVYGKNYTTNKYEVSSADYKSCTPSYAGLTAIAKPVAFAKGSTSAKMNLTFADNNEWKVFSISARKGQSLTVEAYGCGIKVYLPDKKIHEENEEGGGKASTLLDVVSIFPLQQTGTYLVMLQNAGGQPQRSREVIFKITD